MPKSTLENHVTNQKSNFTKMLDKGWKIKPNIEPHYSYYWAFPDLEILRLTLL